MVMGSTDKLLYNLCIVVIYWICFWYIIYFITGFHLTTITINNGISFNGITFKTSNRLIKIKSLRFRLWGNTKMTIIDDLYIKLYPSISKNQKSKSSNSSFFNIDDEDNITIYPKNFIKKFFVSLLIRHFPLLDLELRNTTIISASNYKTTISYVKFNQQSRKSSRNTNNIKFKTSLFITNLNHQILEKIRPASLTSFRIEFKISINYKNGSLDDLKTKINISESNISVFNAIKYYLIREENKSESSSTPSTSSQSSPPKSKSNLTIDKILKIAHRLINDISIHIENSKISEIPFVLIDDNMSIEEYYKEDRPKTSLELITKSVSFNISRMWPDAAGFEASFNPKIDLPFHITLSVQLFKMFFIKRIILPSGVDGQDSDEILNMPNNSLTFKSNLVSQLAQSRGFENCVMELYFSASSPIFDVNSRQMSAILYNVVLLKKWSRLQKLRKQGSQEEQNLKQNDTDDLKVESLKARVWKYINEHYPNLDMKLVVEQPKFILRHDGKHTQLLNFSYSLLNFNLSTTESRDYLADLEVLYPTINYHEKSSIESKKFNNKIRKKDIAKLDHFNVKLDIFKNLTVNTTIELNKIMVNLTSLEIFQGVHWLLLDVTKLAETDFSIGRINNTFNEELKQLKFEKEGRIPTKSMEEKLFKYLPSYINQVELKFTNLDLTIGARSVLIPKSDLFESNLNDFDQNHDLRKIIIKLELLKILILNNDNPQLDDTSSASSETLTSLVDTEYWSITNTLENLQLLMPDDHSSKHSKTKPFIEFPKIEMKMDSICNFHGKNQLLFAAEIGQLNINYNRFKLFTLIGSIYLIREFIIAPIKLIKSKIKKELNKFEQPRQKQSFNILDFLLLNITLSDVNCFLQLSKEFKLKLQLSDLEFDVQNKIAKVSLFFIRLLAISPTIENKWCRLVCVDSLNLYAPLHKHPKIDIHSDAIRLIQPHKFIVYELFDNISISLKLAKHLVKLLNADDSKEGSNVVHPHQQQPIPLPHISVKSNHLKFVMEDDPFESELNMIYQLGRIEQKKRLELYSLFETKESQLPDDKLYFKRLDHLNTTISESWIRKVSIYREKLRREVADHKTYLFGNECKFDSDYNTDVVAYPYHAPLLNITMEGFDLKVSQPDFGLDHVADFIYDVGQGVPKDTKYSVMIPAQLDLKVIEMRMHLRDYPLPILYSPRSKKGNASLILRGPLVISEQFVTEDEHIRKLDIPLIPGGESPFDSLIVEKTLSSIKLYTSLDCKFDSDYPTRIVWGTSYNFGIQQFMLNFDQFSKPPVDPSEKLGFWDKLKYILHGSCTIKTRKSLEVGFKGSRDPYDLLGTATGFVLSFKDNVIWRINKNDDSREFFDITAESVSWYIPNYLGGPLLAWTRNSLDSVFLPDSPHFISSCFAYYLEDSQTRPDFDYMKKVFAKDTIELSGGISYKVGFLLQRKVDGKRVEEFKPHYDVQLMNPKFCKDGHDSYAGFRSEYMHMAISLTADRENTYNTIHLSPGAFEQFFAWWKLFASNMMLPIRKGPLFGESKKSVKFSQHLFTNKFSFYLKSLFLSHIYRDEIVDVDDDRIECVGLRAKIDEFSVDLHQRKEPVTLYHEELSKSTKAMKMIFNVGEVTLSGIDMRAVHSSFTQNLYSHNKKNYNDEKDSTYDIYFDNDRRWFDIQDYEEAFLPSVRYCPRKVRIYPLMYSHRFSYERDTDQDASQNSKDDQFGNEDIHNCRIKDKDPSQVRIDILTDRLRSLQQIKNKGKDLMDRIEFITKEIEGVKKDKRIIYQRTSTMASVQKHDEHFHNKFTWLSMLLKWNVNCRNLVLKYIHFVQLKANMRKYLSHESISMLEKIIEKTEKAMNQDDPSSISESLSRISTAQNESGTSELSAKQRLVKFDKILKELQGSEELSEDYLIEVISPQIQLQSEDAPDSVVIVSAPSISGKIVSLLDTKETANPDVIEKRYGVILKEASVFVLNKSSLSPLITVRNPYGAKSNWPPWLGPEVTQNGKWAGEDHLLIQNLSVMTLFYDTEINLNNNQVDEAPKRLRIDTPSIVLTSTSSQYFTLYVIIVSLLFYSEPMSKVIKEKIEKMKFSIDSDDLVGMTDKVKNMQSYYRTLKFMNSNYSFRKKHLSNEELNNYLLLNLESGEIASDIYLFLKTVFSGDFFDDDSNNPQISWLIKADEFILHILEDDRTPILDIALAKGVYRRKEYESGSNFNKIQIGMMQGFNLIQNARFPDFINPIDVAKIDDNLIDLSWTMNRSVGGIKVVEDMQVNSLPLNIKIDEITGEKLMDFIFQTDSTKDLKNSKVMSFTNSSEAKEKELEDPKDDDEFGLVPETEGANKSINFEEHSKKQKDTETGSSNNTSNKNKRSLTKLSGLKSTISDEENEDDEQVNKMIERSKKYFSIISLVVKSITLQITIKLNKGYKRILNVHDFTINLPQIELNNQIMSFIDLTNLMKKLIIKTLLSHIGKLLSNKLQSHKYNTLTNSENKSSQLRPVKKYEKFIPIKELTIVKTITNNL
ncbi:FMP27 [Candida jiufengensis]|uniref:FMP27 n=1 Tax=Candida jiufengensis TaxID=497108 RepID=UPI002224BC11|nr:FMP27 [Candida jiufengensis]KAI5956819.1 FMP27 [Candida jiufengensis]